MNSFKFNVEVGGTKLFRNKWIRGPWDWLNILGVGFQFFLKRDPQKPKIGLLKKKPDYFPHEFPLLMGCCRDSVLLPFFAIALRPIFADPHIPYQDWIIIRHVTYNFTASLQ